LSPGASAEVAQHPLYHQRRQRDQGNALTSPCAVELLLLLFLDEPQDLLPEKREMGRVGGKNGKFRR